jgi:hypothetical protein
MKMSVRRFSHVRLRTFRFANFHWLVAALLLAWMANGNRCAAQLCAQLSGVSFSENFNTLATSGSNNTTIPPEFKFVEAGTSGNLTYTANNGSATTGETYSFGSTGNFDRALGELTTSTVQSTVGACFVNNTNHPFTSFVIGYTGEEWRLAATGTVDGLDFEYSTDATSTTTGTYIAVDELDFFSPNNNAASVGQLDGNAAANRTVFAPFAITPASPIQPESTFYIRWSPILIAGSNTNDGLAIDDFTIGTTLAPNVGGDYNNNGVVDAGDYVIWRKRLNQAVTIPNDITPGTVVAQDYIEWINRFGKTKFDFGAGAGTNIPEPATTHLALALVGVALALRYGNRRPTGSWLLAKHAVASYGEQRNP